MNTQRSRIVRIRQRSDAYLPYVSATVRAAGTMAAEATVEALPGEC